MLREDWMQPILFLEDLTGKTENISEMKRVKVYLVSHKYIEVKKTKET